MSKDLKFFIVDDDIFYLNMVDQILRDFGYSDIQLFENGIDCLSEIHETPDVVFLDHNMDIYSGYEVLRKIKSVDPDIFVVMISAQEEIRTAVDSLKHGAFDYLQKDADLRSNLAISMLKIVKTKSIYTQPKKSFFGGFFNH